MTTFAYARGEVIGHVRLLCYLFACFLMKLHGIERGVMDGDYSVSLYAHRFNEPRNWNHSVRSL